MEIPPGDENSLDLYIVENMAEFADPTRPGMHATPSMDFDIVLQGTVGLELDTGEVILHEGDTVVLNGTIRTLSPLSTPLSPPRSLPPPRSMGQGAGPPGILHAHPRSPPDTMPPWAHGESWLWHL